MTKLVSVINMKGGVGKTTLVFNLGMYLAEKHDKRVLLIDLDPQANTTIVATDPDKYKAHCRTKKTIADVFIHAYKRYGPVDTTKPKPVDLSEYLYSSFRNKKACLDLIPSELMLSSVLKGMSMGPHDLDILLTPDNLAKYDFVILDCAPTNSALTTIALNASRAVLIPMIADSFGSHGTTLMRQVLDEHKHDFGVEVKTIGVVFTMWEDQADPLKNSNEIIKLWPNGSVFRSKIRRDNWYRVSNGRRENIWNSAAHMPTKNEFDAFVAEFLQKA